MPPEAPRREPAPAIAVVDGVPDLTHPCFEGAQLELLSALVSASEGASSHGTRVASILFGQPNSPVPGLAPHARGILIPVFSSSPEGQILPCTQLDLARAIELALEAGAQVINISAGQLDPSGEAHPMLGAALDACEAANVLVVAAAGNDGCACVHAPAADPRVIAVGASGLDGEPISSSNWGDAYQQNGVLAPGDDVLGAEPGGGVSRRRGTSWAAPHVSALAAHLLAAAPRDGVPPTVERVRRAILDSAIGCERANDESCLRLLAGRLDPVGARIQLQGAIKVSEASPEQPQVEPSPPAVTPAAIETLAPPPVQAPLVPEYPSVPAVTPSDEEGSCKSCAASGGNAPQLVYALGQLDFDFPNEARRDSFLQLGIKNPNDPVEIVAHLRQHPSHASALSFTLVSDVTPLYAIQPAGPFAMEGYAKLVDCLEAQVTKGVERISVPGYVMGQRPLGSGQRVPQIIPEVRGMYTWSTGALVEAVVGPAPEASDEAAVAEHSARVMGVSNFLERVYHELRNTGMSSRERALNYAATNAFQIEHVFTTALTDGLRLDTIEVERSPLCRPESDCWDVKLTFFNPAKRLEQAREVFRFTVDVSDVVPVTVGRMRRWHVY